MAEGQSRMFIQHRPKSFDASDRFNGSDCDWSIEVTHYDCKQHLFMEDPAN